MSMSTLSSCHQCTRQTFVHLVVIRLWLLNMWKQVNQWYLVDISMAWLHWSKTRNLFPLPSVIIFWWLVCLSRARYQPNILSQSPVCTRCSINPMNRPFDWWGTAQECWEIGKVRGSRVSEWKRWGGGGGLWLWRVTCDTCLNISLLILKKHRAEPTFLEAWKSVLGVWLGLLLFEWVQFRDCEALQVNPGWHCWMRLL